VTFRKLWIECKLNSERLESPVEKFKDICKNTESESLKLIHLFCDEQRPEINKIISKIITTKGKNRFRKE